MVDAFWIIALSKTGIIALSCYVLAMLRGPVRALRMFALEPSAEIAESTSWLVGLSIVVILFMIDCLFNGMINPIYILISGALLSISIA